MGIRTTRAKCSSWVRSRGDGCPGHLFSTFQAYLFPNLASTAVLPLGGEENHRKLGSKEFHEGRICVDLKHFFSPSTDSKQCQKDNVVGWQWSAVLCVQEKLVAFVVAVAVSLCKKCSAS